MRDRSLMAYYVYKCTSRKGPHNKFTGDWEDVFSRSQPTAWGGSRVGAEFLKLRPGDTIVAYQTDRNTIVGLAKVTGIQPDGGRHVKLVLRPIERLGIKVRPLKKRFPEIAKIPAWQPGPIQTLYDITSTEVKLLIQRARNVPATTQTRRRVLFARIGWMEYYAGASDLDPAPRGGGDYNRSELGHERFNFQSEAKRVYGYCQPKGTGPSLQRIAIDAGSEVIEDVLVIFFAPRLSAAGQVIVGWYRGATVHAKVRWLKGAPGKRRESCGYLCEAKAADAILLPTGARDHEIPRGKGGTGQANVTYALDSKGDLTKASWIDEAIHWVEDYRGPNLLTAPASQANDEVADAVEAAFATAKGQGFLRDPLARKAVELWAEKKARAHYEKEGFKVTKRGKPFDFLCEKGGKTLHVEVKGCQGDGSQIILTPNEVDFSRRHPMELFVVHSITVSQRRARFHASGGQRRIVKPWRPTTASLTPISYWCALGTM